MNNLKYAIKNISINFKNARELKSSFIISIIGMCINNISFVILWFYFGKSVGVINGWNPYDIFFMYSLTTGSYGLVHMFFYGINKIPTYITTGNFDKFLSTPKGILTKVATSDISTSAIGDFIFGIICFICYCIFEQFTWFKLLLFIIFLLTASIITFAFELICKSISFYLMDGENVSNGLYGTFLSVTTYHGGAITGILKYIFIFIIPSFVIGAFPVEVMKNFSFINFFEILILTFIWFYISIKFFYKSTKKYESNNFFGFGG